MFNVASQRSWSVVCCGVLSLCVSVLVTGTQADELADSSDDITVQRDPQSQLTRIRIASRNGRVSWDDVIRGLVRAAELDDVVLRGMLPSGSFDIQRSRSRWSLLGLNLLLGPDLQFRVVRVPPAVSPALLVVVDQRALETSRRKLKAELRRVLTRDRRSESPAVLRLPGDRPAAEIGARLAIVVHGYNSDASGVAGLVEVVEQSGWPCATFQYPTNQPIALSGRRLSESLERLQTDAPQCRVSLVTHSMGGLVARVAIEDPELDAGNVDRLIMIAPPNQGSQLAHFSNGLAVGKTLVDVWKRQSGTRELRLVQTLLDSAAQAPDDLRPGSQFLRKLNARGRNTSVKYSILLGTAGPFSQAERAALEKLIDRTMKQTLPTRLLAPKLNRLFHDLDELERGRGDGVVAVKRGSLEGVTDIEELEFRHDSINQPSRSNRDRLLDAAVLRRLPSR